MGELRESFRVGIPEHADQSDGREHERQPVECPRRSKKEADRDDQEEPGKPKGQLAAWNFPLRRSRISSVDLTVDDPIKCHRGRPGADHRRGDPNDLPNGGYPVRRQDRAQESKRKSEQCMLELDHSERYGKFFEDPGVRHSPKF